MKVEVLSLKTYIARMLKYPPWHMFRPEPESGPGSTLIAVDPIGTT